MSAPKNPVPCPGCTVATRHAAMIRRALTPTLVVKCCPNCNTVVLKKHGSSWKKV